MTVRMMGHHLEFLSLKEAAQAHYESIHVKMPHCWKSHVAAQMLMKTDGRLNGLLYGCFM